MVKTDMEKRVKCIVRKIYNDGRSNKSEFVSVNGQRINFQFNKEIELPLKHIMVLKDIRAKGYDKQIVDTTKDKPYDRPVYSVEILGEVKTNPEKKYSEKDVKELEKFSKVELRTIIYDKDINVENKDLYKMSKKDLIYLILDHDKK
jgi:uncharacterized protein (UPF0248 family)